MNEQYNAALNDLHRKLSELEEKNSKLEQRVKILEQLEDSRQSPSFIDYGYYEEA